MASRICRCSQCSTAWHDKILYRRRMPESATYKYYPMVEWSTGRQDRVDISTVWFLHGLIRRALGLPGGFSGW